MKLKTQKGEYASSNNSLDISKDKKQVSAFSYDWWQYVKTDKAGNVYFNDSRYSPSTSQHQNNTRDILDRLGIKINFTFHCTTENMKNGIKYTIFDEIKNLNDENKKLLNKINTKGTHKKKNEERKRGIELNEYRVKDLKRIKNEHLNKKIIPINSKNKLTIEIVKKDNTRALNYGKYFKKSNGKIKEQDMLNFLNKISTICGDWLYCRNNAPESIDKIKSVLEMKYADCIEFILSYQFSHDLEIMIPPIDSVEHKQLKSRIKSMQPHPNNEFILDKMHTYLINKLNRKNYIPSEPRQFPINKRLAKLEYTKGLRLIKTDMELRQEGRSQSHCIGGADYILQCLSGNTVLNYKGYTFFLCSDLLIMETSGKHNTRTPEVLKQELQIILNAA